ncbi:DEDDh family exonuclease [Membranihabitans marinus]
MSFREALSKLSASDRTREQPMPQGAARWQDRGASLLRRAHAAIPDFAAQRRGERAERQAPSGQGYAVIDFETTGFHPGHGHRVAELAVVLTDLEGHVVDEWCTLVNPQRDLGPTHVHRIQGRDARRAPFFGEVLPSLVELLRGRVLVAHNAPFDMRFLGAEVSRVRPEWEVMPVGVCTQEWMGRTFPRLQKLDLKSCCTSLKVQLDGHHEALSDARAAAGLLPTLIKRNGESEEWRRLAEASASIRWPDLGPPPVVRPERRRSAEADLASAPINVVLKPGDRVVFTGDLSKAREECVAELQHFGFTTGGMTKATKLLVAADVHSLSGKAEKALKYGIPIVDEREYRKILARSTGQGI